MSETRETPSAAEVERLLRKEWWLNHGCGFRALYGDDGEMACNVCLRDFKRDPLRSLEMHVYERRLLRAREAMKAGERG